MRYLVTKRLTFDDVKIYEVGEVVPLTDEQVAMALAVNAINPTPMPEVEPEVARQEDLPSTNPIESTIQPEPQPVIEETTDPHPQTELQEPEHDHVAEEE